jgi:GNAT superfamily N-acetyltransferase
VSVPITVRAISPGSDTKKFIRFQWKIYEGNSAWVPPLLLDRKKLIDRKNNPFYKHSRMELFLAERDGDIVGRIGAIVNDNHNKEHNENIGFFGFFECFNDRQVANALFDAAGNWLRKQGVTAMRGPASPSVNDEYGLLVDGFDKSPAILMAYNPDYYQSLVESYGFAKQKDLYAWALDGDKVFKDEKFVRVSEALKARGSFTIRTLNMKEFDRDVKIIQELYTRGWERNWGEVPLTDDEFQYMAKDLKPVVNPGLVIIAELKGKAVGFAMTLPDLNMILKNNRKGYLLPALFRILTQKKTINHCRIVILGVLPEYLSTGLGGLLFYETGRRGVASGYPYGEASWVLEDNVMMNRGAKLMNGEVSKVYRIYQKPL